MRQAECCLVLWIVQSLVVWIAQSLVVGEKQNDRGKEEGIEVVLWFAPRLSLQGLMLVYFSHTHSVRDSHVGNNNDVALFNLVYSLAFTIDEARWPRFKLQSWDFLDAP